VALGRALDAVLAAEYAPYGPSVLFRFVHSLLLFLCLSVLYSGSRAAKCLGFRYTENRTKRHLGGGVGVCGEERGAKAKVVQGCCRVNKWGACRTSGRGCYNPDDANCFVGFRVVLPVR